MAERIHHAHEERPALAARRRDVAPDAVHPLRRHADQREVHAAIAVHIGPLGAVVRDDREVVRRDVLERVPGVAEEVRRIADARGPGPVHVEVDLAVVVEVLERAGVVAPLHRDAPRGGDILELPAAAIQEEAVLAVVRGEDVEPAVTVHVGDAGTHRSAEWIAHGPSGAREPGRFRDVGEVAVIVVEESVLVAVLVGDVEVEPAVLVVVEPHGANGLARIGEPDLRRDLGEVPVVVAEEHVGPVAPRDKEIEIAIAVEVHPRELAHLPGGDLGEARRRGDVGEVTVRVAIEAEDRTARGAGIRRESHDEIGMAVAIEVAPRCRARRARIGHARLGGHVPERTPFIMVEPVRLAVHSNEEVGPAVAVVIGEGIHQCGAARKDVRLNLLERRRETLHYVAALHHPRDTAERLDVLERIALDRDQVGLEAGRHGADRVLHLQRLGRARRDLGDGFHRREARDLHAIDHLARVLPVRAGSGVGAGEELQARHLHRPLEHLELHRDAVFRELEAGLVVVADPEIARLVLEVVLRDEPDVGFEVRPSLLHQKELRVRHLAPVRHGPAAGERGGADGRGGVGVHPAPLAECLGLAARRLNLRVGEGLSAAFANALAREDLDQVGAFGHLCAHPLAYLLGRLARVAEGAERRDDARAEHVAGFDRLAEVGVTRGADALDGGESRHDGRIRVPGRAVQPLCGSLAAVLGAAIGAEVRVDVDVRVDEAREDGVPGEVERDSRAGGIRGDALDPRSAQGDEDVLLRLAAPIDEDARPHGDGLLRYQGCSKEQGGGKKAVACHSGWSVLIIRSKVGRGASGSPCYAR